MPRPQNFEDILLRLPGARQSGDNWTAPCPLSGHKTPAGHLTLRDVGDKALVTCQGGKHSYRNFCEFWGFDSLTYSDNGIGGDTTIGQGCCSVTPLTDGDTPLPTDNDTLSKNDNIPDYPTYPCHNCGCGDYWLTDWNQWLCSRCHPKHRGGGR